MSATGNVPPWQPLCITHQTNITAYIIVPCDRALGELHPIGLLVAWWNNQGSKNHAFEAGPTHGVKGKSRGQCDAVLADAEGAAFVVEVEGHRDKYRYVLNKIGRFFESARKDLASVRGAIVIVYTFERYGRRAERKWRKVDTEKLLHQSKEITRRFPDQEVVIVTVDKKLINRPTDSQVASLHGRNDFYRGEVRSIVGIPVKRGLSGKRVRYWPN